MQDNSFLHSCHNFLSPFEDNSYTGGVKLRSEMENTASWGFSSFAVIDFQASVSSYSSKTGQLMQK